MAGPLLSLLASLAKRPPRRTVPGPGGKEENPFVELLNAHAGRLVYKWDHYLEIYHRHFRRFRGRAPVVLEIGVFHGGSLELWHAYFGSGTQVVGVDIDPRCRAFEDETTTIIIGDQGDRRFLAGLRERVPRVDILIDDGGHTMEQQIATFEELYPHVAPDGVYLCEDVHTSLWERFGGGARREDTFLQYGKRLIDRLNAWHSQEPDVLDVDEFTRSTHSMHFYDSVLVIEKRPMQPPKTIWRGSPSF